MDVKCVYCGELGGLRVIHRHLVEEHLDQVITASDEETNEMQYDLGCLFCDEAITRRVKPRSQNRKFLDEFKQEIGLVAFDRLIFHLVEDHPEELGIDPSVLEQLIEE
jgi:hypothetical protein